MPTPMTLPSFSAMSTAPHCRIRTRAGSRFQAGSEGRAALAAVRPVPQTVVATGGPLDVSLSVGVDHQTNSIIVQCPAPLFADVQTLVEGLDKAASESKQMVKIISVRGADPYLVQQAIEAIQGRSTNANRGAQGTFTGTGTGNFGGGTPGGGGGFGGGGPGGGNLGLFGGGGNFGGGGPGAGGFGGGNRGPRRRRLRRRHARRRLRRWRPGGGFGGGARPAGGGGAGGGRGRGPGGLQSRGPIEQRVIG